MFPIEPFGIVTVVCGVLPLLPVHPVNVYPVFVGFFNVIVFVSIVYVAGFPVTLPPPKLYVIVYVVGLYVTVHVVSFVIFDTVTVLFCIVPFWLFVHVIVGLEYPSVGLTVNVALVL